MGEAGPISSSGFKPLDIHTRPENNPSLGVEISSLDDITHLIEPHIGCSIGDLKVTTIVLPLYAFYQGIFLRLITSGSGEWITIKKGGKRVPSQPNELVSGAKGDHEGTWGKPEFHPPAMKKYIAEFERFVSIFSKSDVVSNNGWNKDEASEQLRQRGLSSKVAENFWRYISGQKIDGAMHGDLLKPRRYLPCAWPMGCPQNIPLEDGKYDEFKPRYAGRLSREGDHCRPKSIGAHAEEDQKAIQPMCKYHNMLKGDIPVWDIDSLYAIFCSDLP